MPLENLNEIDAIGIDKAPDSVVLSIVDYFEWDDVHAHLLLLQEKLNTYLSVVESNEILDLYPKAQGRKKLIRIYFRYDIPNRCLDFLEQSSRVIENAGFKLEWVVSGEVKDL